MDLGTPRDLAFIKSGRKMVSLEQHPLAGIISKSGTYLSTASTGFVGHKVSGGAHARLLEWYGRPWHASAEPVHTLTSIFCCQLPYEPLMCTNPTASEAATPDVSVGPDYYNANYELTLASQRAFMNGGVTGQACYAKCNWAEHFAIIDNFSRYDLLFYVEHWFGAGGDSWDLGTAADISGTTRTGFTLPTIFLDQKSNIQRFRIPGTLDSGDKSVRRKVPIGDYMGKTLYNKLFGPEYSQAVPGADTQYPSAGPWLSVYPGYIAPATSTTTQPYFNQDPGDDAADDANGAYQHRVRFYACLDTPHAVFATDEGVTVADGRADVDINSFTMRIESRWDHTLTNPSMTFMKSHPGERARSTDLV